MFTRNIRWVLVAVAVVSGLFALPERPAYATACFLGAASLGLGYFRHGTIWLAFRAQRQGDTERARRLLREIARPHWLASQSQAYYQFLAGVHALEDGAHDAAYAALTRIDARKLRTDNDRSLRQALLAAASLRLGERERALSHLQQARSYPLSEQTSQIIEQLEGEADDGPT